ncbi:MAG: hypothetical protein CM15mP40_11770 [Alphaproteobacteria bacterium]|nr:MAG: hypothetical protein CM15mP40_11770 [Alphaproteobacteria bacterium]
MNFFFLSEKKNNPKKKIITNLSLTDRIELKSNVFKNLNKKSGYKGAFFGFIAIYQKKKKIDIKKKILIF